MTLAGLDIADHIFAAGILSLLFAGQCLRNAIWTNGHQWFGDRSQAPRVV